jgi:hypothetical protein
MISHNTSTQQQYTGFDIEYMYTNTVFNAAICMVHGLMTPVISWSSTTIWHVLISQGPSSGLYAVAHKLLHCWHTDHMLWINSLLLHKTNYEYFYCAQNLKIKRPCDVAPLLILHICLLVVCACVSPGTCNVSKFLSFI